MEEIMENIILERVKCKRKSCEDFIEELLCDQERSITLYKVCVGLESFGVKVLSSTIFYGFMKLDNKFA